MTSAFAFPPNTLACVLAAICTIPPTLFAQENSLADPAGGVPPAEIAKLEPQVKLAEATPTVVGGDSVDAAIVPEAITKEHFSAIRTQSPFLRTLNLAETYSLRAVAEIGGEPVATLYNRETKKTLTVSKGEANEVGISMVEVVPGKNLEGVTVKVSFAGEIVALKYDSEQLLPKAPGSNSGGGGGSSSSKSSDGERRGPSDEDRKRYESLKPEQKELFHQYTRQTMQKYPEMSREERGNMMRGALTRLAEGREIQVDPQPAGGGGDSATRDGGGGNR